MWRTGWVPSSDTVKIAGCDIIGMIYIGTASRLKGHGNRGKCRVCIDPSLPGALKGIGKAGNDIPNWPGYTGIPPQCRATYLDWLASGRSEPPLDPGYMILFF